MVITSQHFLTQPHSSTQMKAASIPHTTHFPFSSPEKGKENEQESEEKKKPMPKSQSFTSLVHSNALRNTVDLCEVFVIIGAHQKTLKKTLEEQALSQTSKGKTSEQISIASEMNASNDLKCQAQILDSYPPIFKESSDIASDFVMVEQHLPFQQIKEQYLYLSNIQLICFPDGYFIDSDFSQSKLTELLESPTPGNPSKTPVGPSLPNRTTKIMHFTITQSCGAKKYLTSLHFKELALINYKIGSEKHYKLCFVPKCLILVSRLPIFSIQRQMLLYIHDDIVRKYHALSSESLKGREDLYLVEKALKEARSQAKVDRLEFYLSTFFHHISMDGSNLEIEIYKKQSRGCTEQQAKRTLVRYVNTFNKECLRLENYDFKLLFKKVKPKMLLQMFVSMLHERKIVLIHNDSSKNAVLIEALISLLYPLQWNFTNISYMIPSMVEYLEAPFPYIIGVPRDLWKFVYEQKWDILGEDVVAFDIDNHRVFQKEALPDFPQPYTQLLIKQLEIQLEKSLQIPNSSRSLEQVLQEEERFWNNFTLKVKQQFLNFFIFLINTFENFYVTSQNSQRHAVTTNTTIGGPLPQGQGTATSTLDSSNNGGQKAIVNYNFGSGGSANDIFKFDEYLQNVRENAGFFEKFVRTQAFINFIEQAFYEEQGNINDASIRFFKECTRTLSKENIQSVRTMQDSIIEQLMHKFNNRSISYSIDKCHLLYDKMLKIQPKLENITTKKHSQLYGLIQRLDHSKIIKMSAFDPTPLIETRYTRGQESSYDKRDSQGPGLVKKGSEKTLKHVIINDMSMEEHSHLIQPQPSFNMTDYFSEQVTPSHDSKKAQERKQFNQTTQHIRIQEDINCHEGDSFFENDNQSPIIKQGDALNNRLDEFKIDLMNEEEEPGIMGFFQKTLSSVKKTFQQTFKNPQDNQNQRKRESVSSPYELSPDLSKVKTRHNNRAARSQTFHVSSNENGQRDKKNNESFISSLFNLATNKKENSIEINRQKGVKSALTNTVDPKNRRHLSNSGFFIFNEEDMKNMTEMSPKNKMGTLRSASFHFDYKGTHGKLDSKQKPTIKAPPVLESTVQPQLNNRLRSISYQNQKVLKNENEITPYCDALANNQKGELLDEKVSVSLNMKSCAIKNKGTVQSNVKFANSNMFKEDSKHPLSPTQSQMFKRERDSVQFQDSGVKIMDTPKGSTLNSNRGSSRKDLRENKQQFEELYKKSTENLFYVPPARNPEGGYKEKYNIWKSKTGRVDVKSSKPPKYNNNASNLRKSQTKDSSTTLPGQMSKASQIKPQQDLKKVEKSQSHAIAEEQKQHQTQQDYNTTDEDTKAPILGKNLHAFKKIMQGHPFEKLHPSKDSAGSHISSANFSSASSTTHHRQLSSGNMQESKGKTSLKLGSPNENIELEEDLKLDQTNKQIESMHIGRVRKRSKNKTAGLGQAYNTNQTNFSKASQLKINQRKSSTNKVAAPSKLKHDPSRTQIKSTGNSKTSIHCSNQMRNKPSSKGFSSSNVKEDAGSEVTGAHISHKVNNIKFQTRTAQSSQSSSSYLSSPINHHENNNQQVRKKELTSHIIKKHQQQFQGAPKEGVSHQKVGVDMVREQFKAPKKSIDLRENNIGEIVNSISHTPQTTRTAQYPMGPRGHSLSLYADQNMHPNKILTVGDQKIEANEAHSKLSQMRNYQKPMNKINLEGFNKIAKLSGDMDNEPHTPQSGANITDEEYDESNV